jgi:hypothetical protein
MSRTVALALAFSFAAAAQTTQGLITGRVVDRFTQKPLRRAQVFYAASLTGVSGESVTGASGYYVLPLLSPGVYRVRVTAEGYQAQEMYGVEVGVAARVDLVFAMRPLRDVWSQGQYRSVVLPDNQSLVRFFGPDVDLSRSGSFEASKASSAALQTSESYVADSIEIRELPLAGRDVYSALVLQPGVAADTGTSRGLGISVHGQRPSASNYLLDGVENNDYLTTGPLATVAPEAVQEYRISTSNYSAEYGNTAGFVANAVTLSGGAAWHGTGYFNLQNTVLDANSFTNNLNGRSRTPDRQRQPGFEAGGPLRRNRLFEFAAVDWLRSRSTLNPVTLAIPTQTYIRSLPVDSVAKALFQQYAPPPVDGTGASVAMTFNPPATVNRTTGIERLDYASPEGGERWMARLAVSSASRPDFIWSPYPAFVSGLRQTAANLAISSITTLRPNLLNEARLGISREGFAWSRAHADVPTLLTQDAQNNEVVLPGSLATSSYRNHDRGAEFGDNVQWSQGRHVLKAGFGALWRWLDANLDFAGEGIVHFANLDTFQAGQPSEYDLSLNRASLPDYRLPQFNRSYRYDQYSAFAQYSLKATSRLALDFGVRMEHPGAPVNTGAVKDALVALGPGDTLSASLPGALMVYPGPGDERLYDNPGWNWAPRFGISYAPRTVGNTIFRASYGIFHDRPFDNVWLNLANNNFALGTVGQPATVNYMAGPAALLNSIGSFDTSSNIVMPTLFQPRIPVGYVQSFFGGVEQRWRDLTLEANGSGALGRKLITTDQVNRDYSLPSPDNADLRYNQTLPALLYRGSQGKSDYYALTLLARYRSRRAEFRAAYTWSHAIDNQSDPLAGDIFNLAVGGFSPASNDNTSGMFTRQFDDRSSRGNSDFDQRQNFVVSSIWWLPLPAASAVGRKLLGGWRISEAAAFRTGFPFSAYGVDQGDPSIAGGGLLQPDFAKLIDPANAYSGPAIPGGKQILNPLAFVQPNGLGNTSRNEFSGPGVFNVDLSLSRTFPVARLGESGRLTLRADAYNVLNHANLNTPISVTLSSPGFGQALYGRVEQNTSFPSVTPFRETPRQVQLLLRIEF